jgi:hypothetical protein
MAFQLWRNLAPAVRDEYAQRFAAISKSVLFELDLPTISLVVQWLLEQSHCQATHVADHGDGFEITMNNLRFEQTEYLRFFPPSVPANALYEILDELKGKSYQRVRVYTLGVFTEGHRRAQKESPLFWELVDGEGLLARLNDMRRAHKSVPVAHKWFAQRKREPRHVARSTESRRTTQRESRLSPTQALILAFLALLAVMVWVAVLVMFLRV